MNCHLSRVLLAAVVVAAIGNPIAVGDVERPRGEDSLPLVKYVEPIYPPSLHFRGVTHGFAKVLLTVAPSGALVDAYATGFSHSRFAEAAIDAIRQWEFAPDRTGTHLPRLSSVRFDFSLRGAVVVEVRSTDDLELGRSLLPARPVFETYRFDDLDSVPEHLSGSLPSYPEDSKAAGKTGRVEILFHVDPSGQVRVPMVTYSDDPKFAEAALDAIAKWSFSVPKRHGRPASAYALQRFTFGPRLESNG